MPMAPLTGKQKLLIVGGGFAGLAAARNLARADLDITLVDRQNHHVFQPLLYQVASAGLSAPDIASPLRNALAGQNNIRVLLGEVQEVCLHDRFVRLLGGATLAYDYLILAAGAVPNYFGHDEWAKPAPSLKSLKSAIAIRERVLLAMERAELEADPARRRKHLTFAVVGAGPTGVEMAGALAELGRLAVPSEYRRIGPEDIRIELIEMGDRVLPGFSPTAGSAAQRMLEDLGVSVRLGAKVERIGEDVTIEHSQGRVSAGAAIWASGVQPVGLAQPLEVELDRKQRVVVEADCSLPGHPEVFVLGDMASCTGPAGDPLPALAAVAVQQGKYAASAIERDLGRRPREAFAYNDRGSLATIGRGRAVADIGERHLHGNIAWWMWSLIHIYQLIGLRNRANVLLDWAWQYLTPTRRAGKRVIVQQTAQAAQVIPERHALASAIQRYSTVQSSTNAQTEHA